MLSASRTFLFCSSSHLSFKDHRKRKAHSQGFKGTLEKNEMSNSTRISKRKLANPIQAPPNLGYNDPVLEAQARKTRYLSLSLKDLVASDAPIQIWTTKRPNTPYEEAKDNSSVGETINSHKETLRLDLGNYLAKIPTSNDRAFRGKLDKIVTCADHPDAYKEPDTPSSLPPRNTVPKNNSPTYIPPGRRGSRVSANFNDRPHHSHQTEVPLVQAPLPRRSYSSTSIQSLHAAKRSISLKRTSSADSNSSTVEANAAFVAVQPVAEVVQVAKKRGRPRKSAPSAEAKTATTKPENLVDTWGKKRNVHTPLVSPSTGSTGTASASTADDSTLDDEDDQDFYDEDEEDETYVPKPSHHKKVKVSASHAPRASNADPLGRARETTGSQHAGLDRLQSVHGKTTLEHSAVVTEVAVQSNQWPAAPHASTAPYHGTLNEKKRSHAEITSPSDAANVQLPPYRKLRLGKPLNLTLTRTALQNSVPRLHSPLSQSFDTARDQATAHIVPNGMYHSAAALSV